MPPRTVVTLFLKTDPFDLGCKSDLWTAQWFHEMFVSLYFWAEGGRKWKSKTTKQMRVLNEWRYSFFPWTCNECLFVPDTVHSSCDTKISDQYMSPHLLEALEELIVITPGTNTGWWQLAEFFCLLGGSVHLLWDMRLWYPKIILLCAHLCLYALPHASTQISLCPSSNLPLSVLLTSGQAIHHRPTGLVCILPDVTNLYSHG